MMKNIRPRVKMYAQNQVVCTFAFGRARRPHQIFLARGHRPKSPVRRPTALRPRRAGRSKRKPLGEIPQRAWQIPGCQVRVVFGEPMGNASVVKKHSYRPETQRSLGDEEQ